MIFLIFFSKFQGMGYDPTKGLGKNKQGITVPVEATSTVGRRGLGLETKEQLQAFFSLNNKFSILPSSFLHLGFIFIL